MVSLRHQQLKHLSKKRKQEKRLRKNHQRNQKRKNHFSLRKKVQLISNVLTDDMSTILKIKVYGRFINTIRSLVYATIGLLLQSSRKFKVYGLITYSTRSSNGNCESIRFNNALKNAVIYRLLNKKLQMNRIDNSKIQYIPN